MSEATPPEDVYYVHPNDMHTLRILHSIRKELGKMTEAPEEWSTMTAKLKDTESPTFFADAKRTRAALENMRETIKNVDLWIDEKIEFLEEQTVIAKEQLYQRQFPTLPDEVLATVFELSLEDPRTCYNISRMPVSLSHVSRRFRRLALKLPRLWRTVSTSQSYHATRIFLKRAGKSKLSVVVRYDNGHSGYPAIPNSDIKNFFKLVCPLYRKWSDFTLCCAFSDEHESKDKEDTDEFIAFIDMCSERLDFDKMPSLTSAVFDVTPAASDVICEVGPAHFKWWEWDMVNIRNVSLFGARHTESFGGSLTSLTINYDAGVEGYVNELFAMIKSNSGIEELDISALDFKTPNTAPGFPECELKRLKKFTLRAPENVAQKLMCLLDMPAMTHFHLKLLVRYGLRLPSNWLETATRRSNYHKLESFSLDIERSDFSPISDTPDLIGPALARFENLKHLRLNTPNTPAPPLSHWSDKVPSLRTLQLENCDQFGPKFLNALKKKLDSKGAVSLLKTLEVRSCEMLSSEEMVREVFPETKIVFEKCKIDSMVVEHLTGI